MLKKLDGSCASFSKYGIVSLMFDGSYVGVLNQSVLRNAPTQYQYTGIQQ